MFKSNVFRTLAQVGAVMPMVLATVAHADNRITPATVFTEVSPLVRGDAISAYIEGYASEPGGSIGYVAQSSDESYADWLLGGTDWYGDPYAPILAKSLSAIDGGTRRAMSSLSLPARPDEHTTFHHTKVWDLGFAKMRTDTMESFVPPALQGHGDAFSLMRSGVDADIYLALSRGAFAVDYPAVKANYALGLQVLRDRLAATDRKIHAEKGLRSDVLDRFLRPSEAGPPTDFDLNYLVQLLDGELSAWRAGGANPYIASMRSLPPVLRLGRVAAAFQDRRTYANPPCLPGGYADRYNAGFILSGTDTKPLCFLDATDRGTHQWYAFALKRELARIPPFEIHTTIEMRLAAPLRASSQGRVGGIGIGDIEQVSRVEIAEAKAARKLLGEGSLPYAEANAISQRAVRLTCRRTP